MKIKDGLYRYPGLGGTMARAHLRVYDHEGSVVAIVGELTDNPSTSITGSAERVCYLLRTEYGPGVIVIQYHPGTGCCGIDRCSGGADPAVSLAWWCRRAGVSRPGRRGRRG
jgi:hypothetical protein